MRKNSSKKKFSLLGLTWTPMWMCFAIAGALGVFGLLFYIGKNEEVMILMFFAAIFPLLIGIGVGILESMRYEFTPNHIKISLACLPFLTGKQKYSDYSGVVIAYARVRGGRYNMTYYMTSNTPSYGKVPSKLKKKKLPTFLFFIPHGYDTSKLSVGMTSAKERRESYPAPGRIARFDFFAFEELLRCVDLPIRILEDVYLENTALFDESIEHILGAAEKCFIVSGSHIPYMRYKELQRMRKEL